MKVVIDISKLPCKNGKSCVDCHFYTADICDVPTRLERFPKVEERPHSVWITRFGNTFITCNKCGYMKGTAGPYFRTHFEPLPNFCEFCGADMREGEQK